MIDQSTKLMESTLVVSYRYVVWSMKNKGSGGDAEEVGSEPRFNLGGDGSSFVPTLSLTTLFMLIWYTTLRYYSSFGRNAQLSQC